MGRITIEYDEADIKQLVLEDIHQRMDVDLEVADLSFEVKSKNNYKPQEWETGAMRVRVEKSTNSGWQK